LRFVIASPEAMQPAIRNNRPGINKPSPAHRGAKAFGIHGSFPLRHGDPAVE
jgi:hypothetical protein